MQRDFQDTFLRAKCKAEKNKVLNFFWKVKREIMEYIHFSAYLTKKKHRKDNPENND